MIANDNARTVLTAERLRELLHYDPETGKWTWRVDRHRRNNGTGAIVARAGDLAGSRHHSGYTHIRIDGRKYGSSRLAWLYMTGAWPLLTIDHRNTRRDDDSWSNLRLASASQQCANQQRRRDNKSGLKGVCFNVRRQKFVAAVQINGKRRFLGYHLTAEAAHAVYAKAANDLHGAFARTA
jgi:hypothetical protein